jgi:mRNA-degrading endonuclease RelE of RelBE toxin-antitoxin system
MAGHDVYLHLGLLDAVPKTGVHRQRIMDFIKSLRENPDTQGDITDRDDTDRTRQIKVIGDYAITYWLDAPVKIVMVVDIRHADR